MVTAENYMYEHWIKNKIWRHLEVPKHQERLRTCAEFIEGEIFADVGCALGHSTEIMSRTTAGNWLGVDFYPELEAQAETFFPPEKYPFFRWQSVKDLNDLKALEYRDIDSVVCSEVIEHVDDDAAFVEALWHITGRVLVVTTPNRWVSDPGHIRVYDKKMLDELFGSIEHVEIKSKGTFWYIICRRLT